VDEHDQRLAAAELQALVGLVLEHALVRDEELLRERERRLGGIERFAAQRMGGRRKIELEPRPQDPRPSRQNFSASSCRLVSLTAMSSSPRAHRRSRGPPRWRCG
jgi:hypothetical protein